MKHRGILPLALLLLALGTTSCAGGRKLYLVTSPDIPAADGEVKLRISDNGNTRIGLEVKHLAPPDRVIPGAHVYVVWARGLESDATAHSLGALRVDDNLRGSLDAVTPLHSFDLFVTAEPSQLATLPSGVRLLTTRVEPG